MMEGISFEVLIVKDSDKNYLLFETPNIHINKVHVVGEDGQIIKMDTKERFTLPLVQFDNNFVSSMYQIINRNEHAIVSKLVVEECGRVGFFSIVGALC